MVAYCTGSNPIEISLLWSKVKVTVKQNSFFLDNSLLTSPLLISALLCPIKMKLGLLLKCALSRFIYMNVIKIKSVMTLWRLKCSPNNLVYISNSIEPKHFILGTHIQQHKVHLMIRLKVTFKVTGECQRSQKYTNGHISYTHRIISDTKVQYNTIQYATSKHISYFYLDARPRSHVKVKSHRRGGVCVLWMLLVCLFVYLFKFKVLLYIVIKTGKKITIIIKWTYAI